MEELVLKKEEDASIPEGGCGVVGCGGSCGEN
jgi:hypothetical protein